MATDKRIAPSKNMWDALEGAGAPKDVYHKAKQFLDMDLGSVKNDVDFARAYDGLLAAQKILIPIHPYYRDFLFQARKTLDSYRVAQTALTPKEWVKRVQRLFEKTISIYKQYVPQDVWDSTAAEAKKIFTNLGR